jgi:hypothetical protein
MPTDHSRKAAIRARMASAGETYRQAALFVDCPPVDVTCPGTGPADCPLPDCCSFDTVSVCWGCDYVFGATADDPGDGTCPNGCR